MWLLLALRYSYSSSDSLVLGKRDDAPRSRTKPALYRDGRLDNDSSPACRLRSSRHDGSYFISYPCRQEDLDDFDYQVGPDLFFFITQCWSTWE